MNVKRYNYEAQFAGISGTVEQAIGKALLSGNYILGTDVDSFEADFAAYCDTRYCIGVNSGTDALILALQASGVAPGNRIAVQANTFFATVAAICLTGATPVLVDACPETFLMDLDKLATLDALDFILPVHLFGLATDMDRLLEIAGQHGAQVIEDCAQAHGARWAGRPVGSFGRVGCFSFHPSKNLAAAGDAGGCVTGDATVDQRLRMLRHLGQAEQNDHTIVARNSRLDVLQSIVLRAKLPSLDEWNQRRREIAARFRVGLSGLPVSFQAEGEPGTHVYHLFQLATDNRDALLNALLAQGIDATVRYPVPIHLQPAYAHLGHAKGDFPVAERLARQLLCLPIRPDMSDAEADGIVEAVHHYFEGASGHAA
ncbi:glutamine--scyllo-inositol aminotransferase [Loktanella sp. D2R18]|uniref:DegT/DnrJ/EryC1/StrS family aminotransferase n=1 Tax=Rhodobacterales TaxID=204455 RepID=UPI000DE8F44A|nr:MULTISPECIES: DegT/DnrJ/EryC1/StrS family aminotransferase [Rhodobacterales]MDO6589132.1 DegT/DnrJ/EryC1/StrS family aminotransferase [Yoonia sp. 1_MG-2023]RBW45437.1 glutamine--scyllo-inositol aminotransferase [Loktanella sp. D2R18]